MKNKRRQVLFKCFKKNLLRRVAQHANNTRRAHVHTCIQYPIVAPIKEAASLLREHHCCSARANTPKFGLVFGAQYMCLDCFVFQLRADVKQNKDVLGILLLPHEGKKKV